LLRIYAGRRLHRVGDFHFRRARVLRARLRKALTIMQNLVLGIISAVLCGYLIFAMVRPEKF
jgi:K+-transporting ATPase KdpF subunit